MARTYSAREIAAEADAPEDRVTWTASSDLATRDLAPRRGPHAPPAIVFVDLSGCTRLTEERGDETAVRTAMSLRQQADATAARHGGRLVKLLGDGAMLLFPKPAVGVDAALDLVEVMSGEGALVAHAGIHSGPVIERDLDVFGRTVNLASRIADVAEPGEVLASDAVAEAVHDGSYGVEPLDVANLKGIPEPVQLLPAAINLRHPGKPTRTRTPLRMADAAGPQAPRRTANRRAPRARP